MARLRFNNVYGSLGATQFVSDTTITFAVPLTYNDGQSLPTISSPDTFDITVEPNSGNFEVERITAYASGALTATVTRGIYGAAKQHTAPAGFVGAPNTTDYAGAAPSLTLGTSNTAGSGQARVDADASIAIFDATAPVTQALADAAATGAAAVAARRDHKHGMPSAASPSLTLGTANAAGASGHPINSDASIAAFDATVPVTQSFSDAAATGSANVAARRDHKHGMPTAPAATGGVAVYGDGSDGAATFDGTTTVLGLVPSSSTYTLTRDLFLTTCTINSGVAVITAGYRLFCQGTLTNNGNIAWDGASGAGGAGGAALVSGSIMGGASLSGSGGNGSGASGNPGGGGGNRVGGVGGNGGNGSNGTGGAGASPATPAATSGTLRMLPNAVVVILGWNTAVNAGAGGGGGAGDASNGGAGGGGGGGIIVIVAKVIAGTGAIHARGGAGGIRSLGNVGGGGGGGGGAVIVVSSSVSSGAVSGQTIDAGGGSGSAGVGSGTAGTNGGAGSLILLPN